MGLIYRPNHPQSNENGFVERSLIGSSGTDPRYYVISDTMAPTRHMATGKYHTSKAAFRADTKAAGCVEIGTDAALTRPRKPLTLSRDKRREDIRRTIYNLRNGVKA